MTAAQSRSKRTGSLLREYMRRIWGSPPAYARRPAAGVGRTLILAHARRAYPWRPLPDPPDAPNPAFPWPPTPRLAVASPAVAGHGHRGGRLGRPGPGQRPPARLGGAAGGAGVGTDAAPGRDAPRLGTRRCRRRGHRAGGGRGAVGDCRRPYRRADGHGTVAGAAEDGAALRADPQPAGQYPPGPVVPGAGAAAGAARRTLSRHAGPGGARRGRVRLNGRRPAPSVR